MAGKFPAFAIAALAVGLVASGCNSSSSTATSTPSTTRAPTASSQAPATTTTTSGSASLQSLIPTPANTARTDGPDGVQNNGTHLHFLVNGSPTDVMGAYKTALEGQGWSVTVESSGGGGGGGGATYTGTNGNAYGVFTGGGYGGTTDIDACAWPSKPAKPNCGHHSGH